MTEEAVDACFETGVCRYTSDALICDGLLDPRLPEDVRALLAPAQAQELSKFQWYPVSLWARTYLAGIAPPVSWAPSTNSAILLWLPDLQTNLNAYESR